MMSNAGDQREWKIPADRLMRLREAGTKGGHRPKTVEVTVGWADGWKYDLKALVCSVNGEINYMGTTRPDEVQSLYDGALALRNVDDIPSMKMLTIKWHPDIAHVALSVYSLRRNGTGSFREHEVFTRIEQSDPVPGTRKVVEQRDHVMTDLPRRYTWLFGGVSFGERRQLFVDGDWRRSSKVGSRKLIAYANEMPMYHDFEIDPEGGPDAEPRHPRS